MPTTSRPQIGFSSREAGREYFLTWQRDYWFSIRMAGGVPQRLYPEIVSDADAVLDDLDGLLLTGGGDIDPRHYGQPMAGTDANSIYPDRDTMEFALLHAAMERRMPILGICRGLQVVNVALGGRLTQHVDGHSGRANSFSGPLPHHVNIRARSLLDRVLAAGDSLQVNSYHHQAVCESDLAPALIASASAADCTIEAVEHPVHPWLLAVQWHPERQYELDPVHAHLFSAFVQAARQYHQSKSS